jgi:carbohydrate-selective porin OprB
LKLSACLALVVLSAASGSAWSEDDIAAPSDWLTRSTLTGDWGGRRTWLQDHGIRLEPRLSQFYQGVSAGDVTTATTTAAKRTCA